MTDKLNTFAREYCAMRDNTEAKVSELAEAKKRLDKELGHVNEDALERAVNEWLLQPDPWKAFFQDGVYQKVGVSFKVVAGATTYTITETGERVSVNVFLAQAVKRKRRLAVCSMWTEQAKKLRDELSALINADLTKDSGGSVGKTLAALQGLMEALYLPDGVRARRQDVRWLRMTCARHARQIGRYYRPTMEAILRLVADVYHVQLTGKEYEGVDK